MTTGLVLAFDDGRTALTALPEVQTALQRLGIGVWPFPLDHVPAAIRRLLGQAALTADEATCLRDHFLLPRQRLLEIIAASGRTPNVPGGGALETAVTNAGYAYPQLWVVQGHEDYRRFDRFHINVAADGTGVDEIMQLVAGQGVAIRVRQSDGSAQVLRLACPNDRAGWLVSYDGAQPHIGSLSSATPGTKLVVQVIGPRTWELQYV
jgi:hypothetical protein